MFLGRKGIRSRLGLAEIAHLRMLGGLGKKWKIKSMAFWIGLCLLINSRMRATDNLLIQSPHDFNFLILLIIFLEVFNMIKF